MIAAKVRTGTADHSRHRRTARSHRALGLFLRRWLASPNRMGSVMPSTRSLARAMARASLEARTGTGPAVELGAGTGSITEGLIEAGFPERELILVERDPVLCRWLGKRFPGVTVIEGEGSQVGTYLRQLGLGPASVVVSSLPLRNMDPDERTEVVRAGLGILAEGGSMLQYTYARHPAIACHELECRKVGTARLNVPPAGVWRIRRTRAPHDRSRTGAPR